MKSRSTILLAALLALMQSLAHAAEPDRFPFTLPWDDDSAGITSMANLNPAPAGGNGFVTARNGHFYDEKGRRVRFLGVNMAGGANFPDKMTAEKVAARLHKFGVNIVRLYGLDADSAMPSLFDRAAPDRQHLSANALDRLDYFIYQLKQHGIYANINLHVAREFTAGDGLPETDALHQILDFDKAVDVFDARMIELQKNYARDLLTHRNPYTQTRYVEEPGVAVIEINNEDTLVGEAWSGKLERLPPHYKMELGGLWNAWLKRKYGDTAGLQRAWGAADKPFGPNLLQNALFEQGAIHWNLEMNTPPAIARLTLPEEAEPPSSVKGRLARVLVSQLGPQNGNLQLQQNGLDLVDGEPYTVSFWARAEHARPLPVTAVVDKGDYHNVGLSATADLTTEWKQFDLRFTATHTFPNHNRLAFLLGDALGTVDLAGITLRAGAENPLPAGTIEAGNLPFGQPVASPQGQDWIAFLSDTERAYLNGMREYVHKTLGAHANVTGSQASWGGLGGAWREAGSDFVDNHAAWQSPNFPHKAGDSGDWNILNRAMTRDANGGTLPDLARYRVAGKPYTISAYAHPAPNEFRAEALPMLAAFAAAQDWDGIYLFDYHASQGDWDAAKIRGFYDVDSDASVMAFLPAAALMFERFDVPFAHRESRLHIAQNDIPGLMAKNGASVAGEWQDAHIDALDSLDTRFSVAIDAESKDGARPRPTLIPGQIRPGELIVTPDSHGPIRWTEQATDRALFRVDSPSSKAIVGFVGGQSARCGAWEVQAASGGNDFAVLTLSALDGKPAEQSRSLLLTALSGAENRNMGWNAAHTSVSDRWGDGPTLVRGVSANINLNTNALKATVYALDVTGKRLREVDSSLRGGILTFAIRPEDKTVWYEIKS